MIFCSEPDNALVLKEIFEDKHKVTLYLKKKILNKIKNQTEIDIKNETGDISNSPLVTEKTILPVPSMKIGE